MNSGESRPGKRPPADVVTEPLPTMPVHALQPQPATAAKAAQGERSMRPHGRVEGIEEFCHRKRIAS